MMRCQHFKFEARVDVGRLSEKDGGPVTGYTADVRIKCAECGLPFRFIGAPFGYSRTEPMLSVDGLEMRAPIEPAHVPELLGEPEVSGRA
jgi:hypothetical protein